jgi:hypothetical protein
MGRGFRTEKVDAVVRIEDVVCMRMTEKALLCVIDDEEHWIPISQIDDDSEVFDDGRNSMGTLVITAWIAKQRGLSNDDQDGWSFG